MPSRVVMRAWSESPPLSQLASHPWMIVCAWFLAMVRSSIVDRLLSILGKQVKVLGTLIKTN